MLFYSLDEWLGVVGMMRRLSRLSVWGLYVAGYVGLDWLSYIYAVQPLAITPWNPPPALSLILLLRYGLKNWPALFVATLLAEVVVRGMPGSLGYVLLSAALLTLVYTAVAALLLRVVRMDLAFCSLRDLLWLTLVVVLGSLLAAASYVTVYMSAGAILPESWLSDMVRFWLGDLIGILVLAPFMLVLLADRPALAWFRPDLERVIQTASIVAALWVIFGLDVFDTQKFFYPLFLPLIWIAMRHGIRGAVMAIVLTQVGLVLALLWTGQPVTTAVDAQYMMLALAVTGLFLGMAVSERQRVQKVLSLREVELNQALRFAGAAEMTSALAHELNQPLAAIGNYARACQVMVKGSTAIHPLLAETMDKVVSEVGRAGESVHRLREFFRFGVLQRERLPVNLLLREVARSVEPHCTRHDVAISFQIAVVLPDVWVDRVQTEIVLHNLLLNAIQAVAATEMARREVVLEAGMVEGVSGWVEVAVRDYGPGVAPELVGGLFHAFATTKTEGMGLGLAISRSLVEAHGGRLWLDDSVRPGARFCFTLPTDENSEPTANPS